MTQFFIEHAELSSIDNNDKVMDIDNFTACVIDNGLITEKMIKTLIQSEVENEIFENSANLSRNQGILINNLNELSQLLKNKNQYDYYKKIIKKFSERLQNYIKKPEIFTSINVILIG